MAALDHLKKCIGQRIIVGFEGKKIPADLLRLDEEWGLGGYKLTQDNFSDFEQLMTLNEDLWTRGQGTPPFIGIAQEGGLIHEVPEPFTVFPEMAHMGQVSSVSVAYEVGAVIGRELTATGFNLNFAPVLDLNINPDNPIIGRRAISPDPAKVSNLSRAVIRGLHDNSIIACGKHFPGFGDTQEDSAVTLPKCSLDLDTLRSADLLPYKQLIQNPPHLDMVMPSHSVYPKIDPGVPATYSRKILHELLRLEIGFKGLIVTDDLKKKAIQDTIGLAGAVENCFDVGVDLMLVSGNIDDQVLVLETLLKIVEKQNYPVHMLERNYRRVRDIKARHFRVLRSIDRQHARELVGNREHFRIARRLRDGK
jgi:beta-N-acetylhexosaminidase